MAGIVADLVVLAQAATAERVAREMAERRAGFALEAARANAAASERRRAELAEIFDKADVDEQVGRDRLGACRLAHADLDREVERLSDVAANGSDPAARAISKKQDEAAAAGLLVSAHERKVRALAEARGQAEAALEQHDAAAIVAEQRNREALLEQVAQQVDQRLEESAAAARQFCDLLEDARAARTPTAWTPAWSSNGARAHFLGNAHRTGGRLESGFSASGGGGRLFWSFARFAADFVANWRSARGEGDIASPPQEAA